MPKSFLYFSFCSYVVAKAFKHSLGQSAMGVCEVWFSGNSKLPADSRSLIIVTGIEHAAQVISGKRTLPLL